MIVNDPNWTLERAEYGVRRYKHVWSPCIVTIRDKPDGTVAWGVRIPPKYAVQDQLALNDGVALEKAHGLIKESS